MIRCKLSAIAVFVSSLFFSLTLSAQTGFKVKGEVVDANGEPVIQAGVLIEGTSVGVVTDLDGKFEINAAKGSKLEISSIGFKTQKVNVGSGDMRIVLEAETTTLDEVVVVGYGSMKRKEMTSAISHVSSKDFSSVSSIDASMLIQGKVSGVSVSNTAVADPNNYGSIQIRGVSSRSAGNGPFIVVDGIPGGDITNINPSDIESIDVLKDGAASAIYGTRGSNGVILINLKKGSKDGNVHTTYSGTVTLNAPKQELDLLTPEQFKAYRTVLNPLEDLGASTDWFKETTHLGLSHLHTLTLSGGNVRTNYRVTADYRYARGLDLTSNRREYGARASINHTTKSGLFSFTANLTPRIINRRKATGSFSSVLGINPTAPVYDPSTSNGYYHFPAGSNYSNVVESMTEATSDTEIKILEWNAGAQINLLPLFSPKKPDYELTSRVTVSGYEVDKFGGYFAPSTISWHQNDNIKGDASRSFDKSSQLNFDWVNNFSAKFGDHRLRAMAGYSWFYSVASGMSANNKDFTSDGLSYNNLGSGDWASKEGQVCLGSYKSDSKLISFYARVNYDWKERYLLSASIRYEGSSKFGQNHKWGYFPAVSVGWRISDEPFMQKTSSWLDDLKFRYDYGVTGNQDFGSYNSLATYRSFGYYQYNGSSFHVWGPSKNVNTELRWEKGHNQNIGVDFSLFKYRVSGSLNYFIRRQSDLLGSYNVSVPPHLFSQIFTNVGTLKNTGFEFDINVDAIRKDNFSWSFTLVGATNDNRFVSFSNDIYQGQKYYNVCTMSNPNNPGYLQRIEEGQRIGNYYTWRYAGVDKAGNWLIYDHNDNIIPIAEGSEEDKCVTGNGLPKFTCSMTHNFTLGNFDLSVAFTGAAGFDIFNVHDFYFGLQGMTGNVLTKAYSKNAHIKTGLNVITDYFIEKGDYLKLDYVTLGYTLRLNRKFIDRFRVFGTARNLYTLTRFEGVDPSTYEVNGLTPGTFGGSYNYYPSAFQFIFGVQVGF